MQKHRISTDIGRDQFVKVELIQDFELLEILSLKFTQKEAYASYCSDYGVVCGRISINNGLGVPNARVSIFIPLDDTDSIDPVISTLYPYTSVTDRDENGYRYNLLPSRKQHGGHEPTGTFPDQSDILTREEVLEVYEKYYKYTVKTNDSGDFMIWGVPLGSQTIHVDVDLSDMGCFSVRPYDFLRLGYGEDQFKNSFSFKASEDIDSLPQIVRFDKTIEVYPLWGNESICEIGITRTDFDLSSIGVKLEPKAYLIGGVYTDTNKNSVNKNCQVRRKMGRKCDLTTKSGKIESIRFTHRKDENKRPILENYNIDEDIPEDGGFVFPIPMNTEFLYTNEFGENEITNDPNKGVPTASCYRFRFTLDDSGSDRTRKTASYLVPNIREHQTSEDEIEKSYAFSTDWADYPTVAIDPNNVNIDQLGILFNVDGQYIPQDYFYRLTYNKVYTVSSFHSMYYHKPDFTNDRYVGMKELVPNEEDDCLDNVTPPVNYGTKNKTFQLLIVEVVLFMEQLFNMVTLIFYNTLAKVFHAFADAVDFWPIRRLSRLIKKFAYRFQNSTQKQLFLINYPECDECNGNNEYGTGVGDPALGFCEVGTIIITGSTDETARQLRIDSFISTPLTSDCTLATPITNIADFVTRQASYVLTIDSIGISLSGSPITYNTDISGYTYNDSEQIFPDSTEYIVTIRDKSVTSSSILTGNTIEEGCDLYDIPYDENLVNVYYTCNTGDRCPTSVYTPGMVVVASNLSDTSNYQLPSSYDGDVYEPITPSGYVEFSNGIFNIIPGSLSNIRLIRILVEYRRRKRVGKLFCGGIVNYSFIDNWLSGSLYFILFKGKKGKYCSDIIRYSTPQEKYYYRSSIYSGNTFGTVNWAGEVGNPTRYLGRPTTMVDLGPRDEFIKEICTDPSLDPNCSVARSIGATSFQSFGELLGLAINYRMDVSQSDYDINQFFGNNGFNLPNQKILAGDILQLISINNEVGIEEFDLQNVKYMGYSYQYLDPDNPTTKTVFVDSNGNYGPLPITFYLDEDGERVRACLNEPGRLNESSQRVPFFLWDKKGTGFGAYTTDTFDNQSWSYSVPQVQPLQGMTYHYLYNNNDQYLLLPITYTFTGLTIPTTDNITNDVDFDIIDSGIGSHFLYDNKYPGFTVLEVSSGTTENPLAGRLYTRVGDVSGWVQTSWTYLNDFVIRPTQDYYSGNRQILSTPFMFYFGLKSGKTGLDKFIKYFGDKNDFTTAE